MNWAYFKDPVSTVVPSWSLTQEAGSNPFTVMTNIFVTEFSEFSETFRKNSIVEKTRCMLLYIIKYYDACHIRFLSI